MIFHTDKKISKPKIDYGFSRIMGEPHESLIPIKTLQESMTKGVNSFQWTDGETYKISELVPDLVLSNFSGDLISMDEVTKLVRKKFRSFY